MVLRPDIAQQERMFASTADPAPPLLDLIVGSDRLALVRGKDSWTYHGLLTEADRLAAGLAQAGVRAGDRVALHLGTGPEIILAYLACFRMGALAAPLNLRFKRLELEEMLRRIKPSLYIGDTERYRLLQQVGSDVLRTNARFVVGALEDSITHPWASLMGDTALAFNGPEPDAPAVLLSTSGTTGKPKLVVHSQATLGSVATRLTKRDLHADDIVAFFSPMVHASGLYLSLACLAVGATLIMLDAADPDAILDGIETHRCTWISSLPTGFMHLMDRQRRAPRDVSSLRFCVMAGDAPLPGQQEAFASAFGRPLHNVWSSTEGAGAFIHGLRAGSVCRPVARGEIRLVNVQGDCVRRGEPGQVELSGPHIALGYWERPGNWEGFGNGWYATGDVMREDGDGHFAFLSRAKDLIVRAGSNISPVEVEDVLGNHPSVRDAGVVGVPDPVLGQRVVGLVQLVDGADPGQLDEILQTISVRLADYKMPERLVSVPAIPRNGLGKIDRNLLAKML
jgi:long-chain acyl-CoA synthetase